MKSNESETIFRTSDRVILFAFTCALCFLMYAPLLIVLTSKGTTVDYWLAGGVTVLWLATAGLFSWTDARSEKVAPQ